MKHISTPIARLFKYNKVTRERTVMLVNACLFVAPETESAGVRLSINSAYDLVMGPDQARNLIAKLESAVKESEETERALENAALESAEAMEAMAGV